MARILSIYSCTHIGRAVRRYTASTTRRGSSLPVHTPPSAFTWHCGGGGGTRHGADSHEIRCMSSSSSRLEHDAPYYTNLNGERCNFKEGEELCIIVDKDNVCYPCLLFTCIGWAAKQDGSYALRHHCVLMDSTNCLSVETPGLDSSATALTLPPASPRAEYHRP